MNGCWYCEGARTPCKCTEDCGTSNSPIGPCPQSEAGKTRTAELREGWKKVKENEA